MIVPHTGQTYLMLRFLLVLRPPRTAGGLSLAGGDDLQGGHAAGGEVRELRLPGNPGGGLLGQGRDGPAVFVVLLDGFEKSNANCIVVTRLYLIRVRRSDALQQRRIPGRLELSRGGVAAGALWRHRGTP